MVENSNELREEQMESRSVLTEEPTNADVSKKGGFIRNRPFVIAFVSILLIIGLIGGFLYWQDLQTRIYIEKAEIYGPIISLAPRTAGEIDTLYVKEGDQVSEGQNLAKVGGQIVTAKTNGIILWVANTPGQMASNQTVVVKMIDPQSLRIVGHIQEDKGFSSIRVGQKIVFTVDAFDSKEYEGKVETISNSARQSSVVFSISDKREEREFDVTATFDVQASPELKNGMSAKMWIYK
jgi:multidrug resistance efflux pump